MNKAKFIRKYHVCNKCEDSVYLVYEYRGKEYQVCENLRKGNEPLAWQHRREQAWIDKVLDAPKAEKKEAHPIDLDEIWVMLGWDD